MKPAQSFSLLAIFTAALLLLAGVAWLTWDHADDVPETAQWVARTYDVEAEINHLMALVTDIETGTRGFVLTGDPVYLEPFKTGIDRIGSLQKHLESLIRDEQQKANAASLTPLISHRITIARELVRIRQADGFEAARKALASGEGNAVTEQIRIRVAEILVRQQTLLEERKAEQQKQTSQIKWMITGGTTLSISLLIAAFTLVMRESKLRRQANLHLVQRGTELARFRNTLDQTLDCLFLIDVNTLRFTYANRGASLQVGYSTDELLALGPLQLKPAFTEADFRRKLQPLMDGEVSTLRFETVHRHKDGHTLPVEVFMQVVWEQGREAQIVNIVRDITGHRQAKQALLDARSAAEQANAAKGTFLATMSHEIRTPLNGLLGMLELLALTRLDREQRETLEIARDSGRGMGRIIDDILDHAKIAAGKLEIAPEPMAVAQLLPRLVNTYHAVASTKNLVLRQMADPRISPLLLADSLRLLQILGNFVSNALKFTDAGYVEVRADLIENKDGAQTVCFSVKDTGIGMSAEAKRRLFQPFEQANTDTTRLYGGTGLGLAISQRLVEMMGGAITLESAPGAGATISVTLTLPVCAAVSGEPPLRQYTGISPEIPGAAPDGGSRRE